MRTIVVTMRERIYFRSLTKNPTGAPPSEVLPFLLFFCTVVPQESTFFFGFSFFDLAFFMSLCCHLSYFDLFPLIIVFYWNISLFLDFAFLLLSLV